MIRKVIVEIWKCPAEMVKKVKLLLRRRAVQSKFADLLKEYDNKH